MSAAITLLRPAGDAAAVVSLRDELAGTATDRDAECYAIVRVERLDGAFLAGAVGARDDVARALRAAAAVGTSFTYIEGAGSITADDVAA